MRGGGGRSGAASVGIPSRNPLRGLTNATLALSRAVADSTPALAAIVLVLLGGYYQHHKGAEAALRGGGGKGYSSREGDTGGRLFPNGLFGFGVGDGTKTEGAASSAVFGGGAATAAPIAFFEDAEVVVERVVDGDTFVGWFPWAEEARISEGEDIDNDDDEWEYAATPHALSASEGADRDAKRIGDAEETSVPILRRRRTPSSPMTSTTNRKGKGGKGMRSKILTKFRLRRIDAPELAQEGGMASKAALERLLLDGELLYANNKATQPSYSSSSASSDDASAVRETPAGGGAGAAPEVNEKQQRMRLDKKISLPQELTRRTHPLLQEGVGAAASDRLSDDSLHHTPTAEAPLRNKEEEEGGRMRTPHSVFVVAWERDRYGRLVVDVFITYGLFSGFGGVGGKEERLRGGGGGEGEGHDGVGNGRDGISGGLVFAQAQLVRSGHAWAYAAHYAAHDLAAEEAAARADRVGLWSALPTRDPSVSDTSVSLDAEGGGDVEAGGESRRAAGEGDEETVLPPSTQQRQQAPPQHRPYRNYRYDRVGRLLSGWSPEDGPMPPWVFRALDRAGRLEEVLSGEYFRKERRVGGGGERAADVGGRHRGRGGYGNGHSSRRRAGGWSNQRGAAGGTRGKRSTRSGRRHRNDGYV